MSSKTNNPKKRQALNNALFSRWERGASAECHYCGATLRRETATREHIVPLSRGGADAPGNIVLACVDCNTRRGSSDYAAFKALMLPVKQARRAGLPIPQVDFGTPSTDEKRARREARRQREGHYSKALLTDCLIADRMLAAGHSPATIASHLRVPGAAVKIMAQVARAEPGERIAVAERSRLLELVGTQRGRRA